MVDINSTAKPDNTASLTRMAELTTADGSGISNEEQECLQFTYPILVASLISSSIVGVLSVYMAVTLTLHFLGTRGMGERRRGSMSSCNGTRNHRDWINKMIMSVLMITCAVCLSVRCFIDVAVMLTGHVKNPKYITYSRIEIVMNVCAMASMYLVLWVRQWSFYNHPSMNEGKYRKLKVVCLILPFVMVATGIWNMVAFLMDRNFEVDDKGCIKHNRSSTMSIIKFYVLGACTLFYQIVLLSLFVYPLASHARSNMSGDYRRQKSILRVLRRVFIAATICCVTDLVTAAASVIMEDLYPESSFLAFNYNTAINFICLLYTFGDWRHRIMYPCVKCTRMQDVVFTTQSHNSNSHSIQVHVHTSGS